MSNTKLLNNGEIKEKHKVMDKNQIMANGEIKSKHSTMDNKDVLPNGELKAKHSTMDKNNLLLNGETKAKHSVMVYMNNGRLKNDMIKACALLSKINLGIEAFKDEPALFDYLHDVEIFSEYSKPLSEECIIFKNVLEKKRKEFK